MCGPVMVAGTNVKVRLSTTDVSRWTSSSKLLNKLGSDIMCGPVTVSVVGMRMSANNWCHPRDPLSFLPCPPRTHPICQPPSSGRDQERIGFHPLGAVSVHIFSMISIRMSKVSTDGSQCGKWSHLVANFATHANCKVFKGWPHQNWGLFLWTCSFCVTVLLYKKLQHFLTPWFQ